jgi:hypothetical protein
MGTTELGLRKRRSWQALCLSDDASREALKQEGNMVVLGTGNCADGLACKKEGTPSASGHPARIPE